MPALALRSDAGGRLDIPGIRYGQVWEDADVLLEALDVRPGDVCVSIASAGDNALALLTRNPARVIAIDRNPAQLACLELRVAAYRRLEYRELLELVGSRPSNRRLALYAACRVKLSRASREFWDGRPGDIERGIGGAGRFERYLALFRRCVLPLVHRQKTVEALLRARSVSERQSFYVDRWDTPAWRLLFRLFFSRAAMAALGRDRECFRYVEGPVATRMLERTRHALVDLEPADNPYVHWILTGTHGVALPCALREENFVRIRSNLERLSWQRVSVDEFVAQADEGSYDRYNLSDVFEYASVADYERILASTVRASRSGARLVYWNLLTPRQCPRSLSDRLGALDGPATRLHHLDRGFFYGALRIEEVRRCSTD